MLKSIVYVEPLGYDEVTKLYGYLYLIEDTDFDKTKVIVESPSTNPLGATLAIIKFYSERNLNVVANLMILFNMFPDYYALSRMNCSELKPYEDEMEKLLLLQ